MTQREIARLIELSTLSGKFHPALAINIILRISTLNIAVMHEGKTYARNRSNIGILVMFNNNDGIYLKQSQSIAWVNTIFADTPEELYYKLAGDVEDKGDKKIIRELKMFFSVTSQVGVATLQREMIGNFYKSEAKPKYFLLFGGKPPIVECTRYDVEASQVETNEEVNPEKELDLSNMKPILGNKGEDPIKEKSLLYQAPKRSEKDTKMWKTQKKQNSTINVNDWSSPDNDD